MLSRLILAVLSLELAVPAHSAKDAPQVILNPGDDFQASVSAHPPGTSFLIKAGLHRFQSVQPKHHDSFLGEPGSILSGAQTLTSFTRSGALWTADIHVEQVESTGKCQEGSPACNLPEDLFFDNVPLHREMKLEGVGAGRWYLDYGAGKLYVGNDPQGHAVEISLTRYAFAGDVGNVTIKGLTIEKYAGPTGIGAIHGSVLARGGHKSTDWLIEDNQIRLNHDTGVTIGNGMRILKNHLVHNGNMGAAGAGRDVLVDGNEIAYNNYAGYSYHWGSGGAKFVLSTNLQVRNNFVHHNEGPGLWSDIDNDNVIYENNHTSANKVAGIFFEISFGAVIRNNTVDHEGVNPDGRGLRTGGGIVVNTSSDAEIYGNQISDCVTGILAIQDNRGSSDRTGRLYILKNLYVHDNTVTQKDGFAAAIASSRAYTPDVYAHWNNRFQNNTYRLGNPEGAHFHWMNEPRRAAEWKSFQNDTGGRILPLDAKP